MNELKHDHHRFENPNGEELPHRHPPYWKHAHRDWRIWFCVIFDAYGDGDLFDDR